MVKELINKEHIVERNNDDRSNETYRYCKFSINAAIRYGENIDSNLIGKAKIGLRGDIDYTQKSGNKVCKKNGIITLNSKDFMNSKFVLDKEGSLITFHPYSESKTAYRNKLGGLVDQIRFGKMVKFDLDRFSTFYHDKFLENPEITAIELVVLDAVDQAAGLSNESEIQKEVIEDFESLGTADATESVDLTSYSKFVWSGDEVFESFSEDDKYLYMHLKERPNPLKMSKYKYRELYINAKKTLESFDTGQSLKYRTSQNTSNWNPNTWFSSVEKI